jgi:hypothetical protein
LDVVHRNRSKCKRASTPRGSHVVMLSHGATSLNPGR